MIFKYDIIERIRADFGNSSTEAMTTIVEALNKSDYLKTDRVIRSIIFLAEGDLINLEKYIEAATVDTRDVMFWAEYEKINDGFNSKRIRDFNKTFAECANEIKE